MKQTLEQRDLPLHPVGGYNLHLYCRYLNPDHGDLECNEFFGDSKADAYKRARRNGWVFNRDGYVTCPVCAKVL